MSEPKFPDRIPGFADLDAEEHATLRRRARRSDHDVGDLVFGPTPQPRSVYVLESGAVRIYRLSSDGEEATLGYVAPGEVFGELPGFGAFARDSFAVAHAASTSWRVPVGLFRTLVTAHPPLMAEIVRQVADRMKRVESRVEDLILRDVRLRLASTLLELSEHFSEPAAEGRVLRIPLSQMQLGTLIGATRQSVNSTMAEFREKGWVRRRGATLTIVAPDALRGILDAR